MCMCSRHQTTPTRSAPAKHAQQRLGLRLPCVLRADLGLNARPSFECSRNKGALLANGPREHTARKQTKRACKHAHACMHSRANNPLRCSRVLLARRCKVWRGHEKRGASLHRIMWPPSWLHTRHEGVQTHIHTAAVCLHIFAQPSVVVLTLRSQTDSQSARTQCMAAHTGAHHQQHTLPSTTHHSFVGAGFSTCRCRRTARG
jgi:hypothetical protein